MTVVKKYFLFYIQWIYFELNSEKWNSNFFWHSIIYSLESLASRGRNQSGASDNNSIPSPSPSNTTDVCFFFKWYI